MIIEDDGHTIPDVGPWAKEKYSLVQTCCAMFATAMKPPKWHSLVYIDLFAGTGFGKVKDTSEIVATSALLSIDIPFRFNRYIYCDIENDNIASLKKRVARLFPDVDARFLCGDVNKAVPDIIANMPVADRDNKVLAFCFVDPFKLDDLSFATIEYLSRRFMDFLVLVPTDMDANRNVGPYMAPANETVARFTGRQDWRTRWDVNSKKSFGIFVLEEFSTHM
jgi:three-Cys-motif partner protein